MIRRPPRSTLSSSSAASDVYKRQVERFRAGAADDDDIALIELEPDLAFDVFLALVHQRLQHLALRREPEAVIDELRIARHQRVFEVHRLAVEREGLHGAVRGIKNGAARRLVDAAGLHADIAILHQIDAADAVVVAKLVEPGEQGSG